MNTYPLCDERLDFSNLNDLESQKLLDLYNVSLTVSEARYIQELILNRPPTLSECLLWSIEGSEHCSYKSSKKWLQTLPTIAPNLILGVGEDAGVVEAAICNNGTRYGIAISHESHNHPSQVVPFEGAATGVGGNVRDISCMGAEVFAVADVLRFGDIDDNKTKWLHHGIVEGIASYGNALGIANISGNAYYHSGYQTNCLVTVVSLGLVRDDEIIHSYVPDNASDYVIILVGKPTDNSGFGGASFASNNLKEGEANRGAVQEPNAFLERHLLKANMALFKRLKKLGKLSEVAFKDLGAGGIACASVELADGNGYGCVVELDNVHVGISNLHPSVILCSETQERFMWAVPEELAVTIIKHYNEDYDLPNVSFGARAVKIGSITKDADYQVIFQGKLIVDAKANAITQGLVVERHYQRPISKLETYELEEPQNYNKVLLELLKNPNIAEQSAIYQHYDKQVQGRTVLERGRANAGVMAPYNSDEYPDEIRKTGVALSVSHNPIYNLIDSYYGSKKTVVTAYEKVAAVGASPIAITDCLCFGNPEYPNHMWDFVESVKGIAETCKSFKLASHPKHHLAVVSGNVSFYNSTNEKAIPPSPIISCLGRMNDASKAVDSAFKAGNSSLLLVRDNELSLSGSCYYQLQGVLGDEIPSLCLDRSNQRIHSVVELIQKGLVLSSSTIVEGGLAVTLAKMAILGQKGCEVTYFDSHSFPKALFAESGGFVLEISPSLLEKVISRLKADNVSYTHIG